MVNTNTNNNNKISTAPKSGIKTCNQRRSNGKLFQTSGAVTERRLPNTVLQNGTERKCCVDDRREREGSYRSKVTARYPVVAWRVI